MKDGIMEETVFFDSFGNEITQEKKVMQEKSIVKLLVVGSGKECASFLKTIKGVPGVQLIGLLDQKANSSSMRLAQELDISFGSDLFAFIPSMNPDIILNIAKDQAVTFKYKPTGALVIHGVGSLLVRLLVSAYEQDHSLGINYQINRREFDVYIQQEDLFIGKSSAIDRVRELIAQVAQTPTTVLLLGETGTGKELVARNTHQASHLRNGPFISVNCTTLTSSLIESELFGCKKGAFTGAEQDRKGLLEEAHNGTIFLDEIGDMKMELQAKLLRFLQSGEIRPVGSSRTKFVKVRIIAATNRNLEEAVEKGEFRRDLYYRLNIFTIPLPRLSERIEDIPHLAYHFLTKAENKLNKKLDGISDDALDALAGYDWPGNVRELENVIERAVIVCRKRIIVLEDLAIPVSTKPLNSTSVVSVESNKLKTSRDRLLSAYEKQELLQYLKKTKGNVSEASRLSGIPRRTFYRLMKKHGIKRHVQPRFDSDRQKTGKWKS